MSSLLLLTASLSGETSKSRELALELIAGWRAQNPGAQVTTRALTAAETPHLAPQTLAGLMRAPEARSAEEASAVAFADALIAELEAADVVVIAAPMYNFSIPSTLKAWIDHVARAGRTFRYSEQGPVGLVTGKKVYIVSARGGVTAGGPMDFEGPYLKGVLGFLGMTDVTFVHAEGLAMGPEAASRGLAAARQAIADLFPRASAAA